MPCSVFMRLLALVAMIACPFPVAWSDEGSTAHQGASDADTQAKRFFICRDLASAANHGHWTNFMPAEGAKTIKLSLNDQSAPAFDKTAARLSIDFDFLNCCGLGVACLPVYWGEKPSEAAYDLGSGLRNLVFCARGDRVGEAIQVKVAIAGDKPFCDSALMPAASKWISLTEYWKRDELKIDQHRTDLSRTIIPLAIVSSLDRNNESSITF